MDAATAFSLNLARRLDFLFALSNQPDQIEENPARNGVTSDVPNASPRRRVNNRLFPARPILAASVAVFRQGRVMIGRRARAPLAGYYSLPGGGVEAGETLREAALRELFEEVGLEADIIGFIDHVEPIAFEGARVRTHFVIAAFAARWRSGQARVGEEIDDFAWIEPGRIGEFLTTPELPRLIAEASLLERSRP